MKTLPERLESLYDELGQSYGYCGVLQRAADRIRGLESALRILVDEIAVRGIPIQLSDASALLVGSESETEGK